MFAIKEKLTEYNKKIIGGRNEFKKVRVERRY